MAFAKRDFYLSWVYVPFNLRNLSKKARLEVRKTDVYVQWTGLDWTGLDWVGLGLGEEERRKRKCRANKRAHFFLFKVLKSKKWAFYWKSMAEEN